MKIEAYKNKYKEEVIFLILDIQNNEAKISLSLEEQSDLNDIEHCYQAKGGEFWVALDEGKVIGTLGIMMRENHYAVMKKFFVKVEYRSKKVGLELYRQLIYFAKDAGVKHIILDTPSVAKASHKFYEKAGFYKTDVENLPVPYVYPDRDSILYMLDL